MKNQWKLLIIGVLVMALLAACQPAAKSAEVNRQIGVNGTGRVYLVPDIAYIYIGVRSQAEDVASALSDNNRQAQSISDALRERGVLGEDIQTTSFNVYPQQEYTPEGQPGRITYVVENTVYVKVRDLQALGTLLDGVVRAGANSINGISFDIEDRAQAEADARRLAVEDAKAKAAELAELAGVQLGELQSINVYSSGAPMPLYDAKGGVGFESGAPIAAGQLVVQMDANLTFAIK
jgi:uncharacterized protein